MNQHQRTNWRLLAPVAVSILFPVLGSAQFHQHNLVSDGFVNADTIDPDLKNPWGMSMSSTSPIWVSNQVTGNSTLYTGNGVKQGLTVDTTSNPTGQVFNASGTDFQLTPGNPARFLFATLDGKITGWNPGVDATHAVTMVNGGHGNVYTGLGILSSHLFAANFATGGIDIYDSSFQFVRSVTDPNAPNGFAPYNVRAIGGSIFATYAKEDDFGGFVDQFDSDGNFVKRLITDNSRLAEPWGMEIAPATWGNLAGSLLVGNTHTGKIHAYNVSTGEFIATLQENGQDIVNDGLWGLTVGNGGSGGDPNKLYFTAGLNDEQDGLLGSLEVVPEPSLMTAFGVGMIALLKRRRRA